MKKLILKSILVALFTMVISCVSLNSPEYFIGNWKETPLAFSESFQFQEYPYELNEFSFFQVSEGQNLWLRKSENLITTFEIIKKIGLLRFLPKEGYFKANLSNIHWNKPDSVKWSVNDLVQKLFLSYENDSLNEEFFTKFWKRRKMENNDSAVFEILKEINGFYSQGIHPKIGKEKVEGKMFELIKLNVEFLECDSLHKQKHCLKYFDYLRKIGLEHSAYNFIFELESTQNLKFNRDSLLSTLKFDTIPESEYWWTRNNAAWVQTYRDNGP